MTQHFQLVRIRFSFCFFVTLWNICNTKYSHNKKQLSRQKLLMCLHIIYCYSKYCVLSCNPSSKVQCLNLCTILQILIASIPIHTIIKRYKATFGISVRDPKPHHRCKLKMIVGLSDRPQHPRKNITRIP